MIVKNQPQVKLLFCLIVALSIGLIVNPAQAEVTTKYEVKAVSYQYRIVTVGETLRLNLLGTVYLSDPAVRYQIKHENWIIPSSEWKVSQGAATCTTDGNLTLDGPGQVTVEGKGPDGSIYKGKIFATPRFLTKYVLDVPTQIEIGKDYKVRLLIADAVTNAYELPSEFYELKFTGIDGNLIYNPVTQNIRAIKSGSFIIKVVNNSYTTVPNPQNLIVVPISINESKVIMGTLKGRVSWRTARNDWFPLPFTRIKLAMPDSLQWFDSGIKASNMDGYFNFGKLPVGRYRIIAESEVDKNPIFWVQNIEVRRDKVTDVRLSYLNTTSPSELALEYRKAMGDSIAVSKFPEKLVSFGPEYSIITTDSNVGVKINGDMFLSNRTEIQRTFKNIVDQESLDIALDISETQNFIKQDLWDCINLLKPAQKLYVLGVNPDYFKGLGLNKTNPYPETVIFIEDAEKGLDQLGIDWKNAKEGTLAFIDQPFNDSNDSKVKTSGKSTPTSTPEKSKEVKIHEPIM